MRILLKLSERTFSKSFLPESVLLPHSPFIVVLRWGLLLQALQNQNWKSPHIFSNHDCLGWDSAKQTTWKVKGERSWEKSAKVGWRKEREYFCQNMERDIWFFLISILVSKLSPQRNPKYAKRHSGINLLNEWVASTITNRRWPWVKSDWPCVMSARQCMMVGPKPYVKAT